MVSSTTDPGRTCNITLTRANLDEIFDGSSCFLRIQPHDTCIVTHTFASQYDGPDMVAELLCPSFSKEVVHDVVETLSTNPTQSGDMQSQQQANQVQYKEESMVSTQSMMQPALTQHCSSLAHDL
ncbi:uncharacterized protein UDID_19617 [Ustilago sp. UG-2017a]|nr:uncharacterized protein UDID_19617 [Ustilago sp. UG-2017a]